MSALPIGIEVPGRALLYWPDNPLTIAFDWDVSDPTGGHVWRLDVIRGDTGRPTAIWPAVVVVAGQVITGDWPAADTREWGPGTVWRLLRDDVTVLAGKMMRGVAQVDSDPDAQLVTVDLTSPQVVTVTVSTGLDSPAPSTEVAYAQITANQAFTVDSLNIDLVSGLAVTIPNLAVPVYVHALIAGTHSVASAVLNAVLCKTVPAPGTILDALAMGFACCTTAGNQANCAVMARIPPATPCTVQLYVSGSGGTLTVLGQTYAPSKIWAVTA